MPLSLFDKINKFNGVWVAAQAIGRELFVSRPNAKTGVFPMPPDASNSLLASRTFARQLIDVTPDNVSEHRFKRLPQA
jgi:hypothetical protein